MDGRTLVAGPPGFLVQGCRGPVALCVVLAPGVLLGAARTPPQGKAYITTVHLALERDFPLHPLLSFHFLQIDAPDAVSLAVCALGPLPGLPGCSRPGGPPGGPPGLPGLPGFSGLLGLSGLWALLLRRLTRREEDSAHLDARSRWAWRSALPHVSCSCPRVSSTARARKHSSTVDT